MKEETARVMANVILSLAAAGATYYIASTPRLRRMAWGLLKVAITTTLPAYLSREVRQAWAESDRRGTPQPTA
jgi:hypothetical protein